MKGYRPSIASQKRLYSQKLAEARMVKKRDDARPAIASNSEPWGPQPKTLAEAIALSDMIENAAQGWRKI
jgi:hypothetical protein